MRWFQHSLSLSLLIQPLSIDRLHTLTLTLTLTLSSTLGIMLVVMMRSKEFKTSILILIL